MPAPAPSHPRPRPRHLRPIAALLTTGLLVSACGTDDPGDAPRAASVIDEERCETNAAAGTITYITGYHYQASVTQLEVIAADGLDLFDALCLDVEIQPGNGDVMGNAQLVSAGTAHFTPTSNEAEVLQANERDHEVIGIATYGHVPISSLLTGTGIEDLTELEGQTLGHQSMIPAPLEAMLVSAGVDVDSIEQVEAGYDPSILPRDQVQALTGFRSNEPHQLDAMDEDYTEWLPEDFGVVGSFGVMATNPEWAEEHPTVVEDFLRAIAKAFEHCTENGEECVQYAADLDEAGFDTEHNLKVWNTERELVGASTPDDQPNGYIDLGMTEQEGQTLLDNGALDNLPDLEPLFEPRYLEAVHVATEVVWPVEE
ncbi:ABC transporter substrate-binding protein [Nocardiopsis metallicus]|uniref:NitT/TauT family transport system substrate-binding protein n=1 Tax=Nocardiopsis metallicus TaxID=179819 RepID=A0A840WR22_9ACTN|nr:ABC transporter substrate-binding protein [Nocardiopsis metallicus]MBB5494315.1 NitT/TauT family transport system substrate-binding protein [Nocardiopsis metallicus]